MSWHRRARLLQPGQVSWKAAQGMADIAKRLACSHAVGALSCKHDVCKATTLGEPSPSDDVAPPIAPKRSHLKSVHGTSWDDPYHWMSNSQDPCLHQLLQQEQKYLDAVMADTLQLQSTLKREMAGRMAKQLSSSLVPWGPWLYYTKVPEGKDYPVFYRKRRFQETAEPRSGWRKLVAAATGFKKERIEVLVDQNLIAEEHGYAQLGMCKLSSDHRLLAYTVDLVGSELFTLFVKDLNTGRLLQQHTTEGVASMEWASNSRTLFYTVPDNLLRPFRVFGRKLDERDSDYLVFEERDPSFSVEVGRTKDWCFISINVRSKNSSEVYLMDANKHQAPLQLVQRRRPGLEYFVEHHTGLLYILTNFTADDHDVHDSGNFRLVQTSLGALHCECWQTVVAAEPGVVFENMDMFKNHLVLYERKAGAPRIRVLQMPLSSRNEAGQQPVAVQSWRLHLPQEVCSVTPGTNLDFLSPVLHLQVSSPTIPEAFLGFDLSARTAEVLEQEQVVLDGEPFAADYKGASLERGTHHQNNRLHTAVTPRLSGNLINLSDLFLCTRREAVSHDGVSVPITVVHSRKLELHGQSPCLLVGYGAYGESLEINWSSDQLSLLDRGWVLAFAHVRGGGELGRSWYHSGSLMEKKNSFYDFIACAQFLLDQGYAHREKLCAYGTSAGGLLVAASINQSPGLFRAAVLKVPFLDICNTMLDASLPLTVHEYDEWGNPSSDPATFSYIRSYSPCDNVRHGALYPAMLLTASLSDTRVGYWEAVKWVASVRACTYQDPRHPVILKPITGGHFGEGGRYQHLRMTALEYAFLIKMTRP